MIKKIFITLGIITAITIPLIAMAITGDAHREDWSGGQPSVVDNSTTTCNNTATVRYDWSSGVPTEVIDSTATCASVASATITNPPTVQVQGQVNIQGQIIIQ